MSVNGGHGRHDGHVKHVGHCEQGGHGRHGELDLVYTVQCTYWRTFGCTGDCGYTNAYNASNSNRVRKIIGRKLIFEVPPQICCIFY